MEQPPTPSPCHPPSSPSPEEPGKQGSARSSRKEMILEEILSEIGDAGRFQILFTAMIVVMEVVVAWSMLQAAVVGATPSWWCVDPTTLGQGNMTLDNSTFQTCSPAPLPPPPSSSNGDVDRNMTQGHGASGGSDTGGVCVRFYDPDSVTIVAQWDLVCERKYIKAAINSIQMAGVLVGALAAGQLSDSVGRRVTCYVTMAFHGLACLAAGFSPSWEVYAALRFIVGAAIGSFIVLHYVYMIEFVGHTWRPYLASIPAWAIGAGLLCVVAWQLPHWRYLHFVVAGITLPTLFGWFVSPESLRWLAAKGRVEAAREVMDRIAKMNGRSLQATGDATGDQLRMLVQAERSSRAKQGEGQDDHHYSYRTLFKGWRNCVKTLVLGFAWMSMSMSYYGILFGVSALSGNVYLNMFLLTVVDVLPAFITAYLAIRLGRRYTCCCFFILASLTGFAILLADRFASEDSRGPVISAIAICSKLFIGAVWTCMQTFTAELYPTVIRSLGMGMANTAARVGGILAPFVLEMDTADDAVKCYVIVGVIMAVNGVSMLFLTETKGKSLADTLHQEQRELDVLK
ncbi:solute carrier family 22 member 7-like isoform X2 [Babylonia areolata]|uniref:solute carrier family 22 member 7-like isoform X2 n=1 Tax=Babylonia areolata TaxID=304850 RepID=UPI003FD649CB